MKEHPILFSTEMVRAIQEGRKTQTRRVLNPQPKTPAKNITELVDRISSGMQTWKCPYGQVGDILWVRETFQLGTDLLNGHYSLLMESGKEEREMTVFYKADGHPNVPSWRPSIYMPRWASRITLEITEIRVERLQDISGRDVLAEGVDNGSSNPSMGIRWENMQKMAFSTLWDSINSKRGYGWGKNPWVWVVTFRNYFQKNII